MPINFIFFLKKSILLIQTISPEHLTPKLFFFHFTPLTIEYGSLHPYSYFSLSFFFLYTNAFAIVFIKNSGEYKCIHNLPLNIVLIFFLTLHRMKALKPDLNTKILNFNQTTMKKKYFSTLIMVLYVPKKFQRQIQLV